MGATSVGTSGSVLFNMLFANFLLDVGNEVTEPSQRCTTNASVCYDIFGVEEEFSLLPPWTGTTYRPVYRVPQPPDHLNTSFWLFRQHDQTEPIVLDFSKVTSLYNGPMKGTGKLWVVVHGFRSYGSVQWAKTLVKELLRSAPGNEVMVVDWRQGAGVEYSQAVANLRLVARQLAHVLRTVERMVGVPMKQMHLIGHSLGSHLCGITGAYVKQLYNITLARITGLDPASPFHSKEDQLPLLDHTDAHFVDIIHSDNSSILGFPMTVGFMEPTGHLDFYPNGGGNQPGCASGDLKCAHVRAIEYFTESVRHECPYIAVRCPTYDMFLQGECWGCEPPHECSLMGLAAAPLPVPSDSQFFLFTRDRSPFCGHHYMVRVFVSNTTQAQDHDGEFGILMITMEGTARAANPIRLTDKSVYYQAGSIHRYVVLGPDVGVVTRVRITFVYPGHFINPMSWRMNQPRLHLYRLDIQMLNSTRRSEFCFDSDEQKSGLEYVLTVQDICT